VAGFPSETPELQATVLNGVFASAPRIALLFDALGAGRVPPTLIDVSRRKLLLNHPDSGIRRRAQEQFAKPVPADRERVLAEYKRVLTIPADPKRGRAVFATHCATCHRIGEIGIDVAPDISDSRERLPEQLLTDILQPNRAIDANYFSYTAVMTDGQVHTGVLAAETSTSVSMRQAEGKTIALRRDEIELLLSNGVSFMPDGLEQLIPPQDMADLISFIKNWRYLDGGINR
jgi:putative heme-binding domain-containing protein